MDSVSLLWIRALPGDVLEHVAVCLLTATGARRVLMHGPLLVRALVGPGALADQGTAHRLVAQRLGLAPTPALPTWRALLAAVRVEWMQMNDPERTQPTSAAGLFEAIVRGLPLLVRAGLAAGVDPNVRDDFGVTALQRASLMGHLEIVRQLLAAGADVHAAPGRPVNCETALGEAVRSNKAMVVEALAAAGADVDAPLSQGGWTPLTHACMAAHVDVAKALLAAGADARAPDRLGRTARMFARSSAVIAMLEAAERGAE